MYQGPFSQVTISDLVENGQLKEDQKIRLKCQGTYFFGKISGGNLVSEDWNDISEPTPDGYIKKV
jgi:hypothetical protein